MRYKIGCGIVPPKVRQIAFGVYVAIRNSGDAYKK